MGEHQVTYAPRAFRQDASHAMKGDIVRGLVELITNCDDAYSDNTSGKIRIEVEHRRGKPWAVVVRDRASGMRQEKMVTAIGGLGGRTSGFETGANVRGNLGRGAKDLTAFGPVKFESICGGQYSSMLLEEDGTYDLSTERRAVPDDRERMGIPRGSGTVVTVVVSGSTRCPRHDHLLRRLSQHYQLRDINSDPRREVTLVDLNNNQNDGVRYARPSLTEVIGMDLEIDGYPDAQATLTIFRNAERYDNSSADASRPEGILIKGTRAIYENTLFGLESNVYAHWFSGHVVCPYIDELARRYDELFAARRQQDPANPIPIITRGRDGLEGDHPFRKALASAVESVLVELVREEEAKAKESATTETTKMRRTLDRLGQDLGRMVDADLREIDEDGLDGTGEVDDEGPIRIIPANPVLYFGENKTVSVVVSRDAGVDELEVDLDPEGVVELLDGSTVVLEDHPRRDDLLIGRMGLRPLIEDDETYCTVRRGELEAMALIQVRPEREDPEPSPHDEFEFERDRYHMTPGRRRRLKLYAPVGVVNAHGTEFSVQSNRSGVVPLGGGGSLKFDEELLCYVGQIEVDPRVLGQRATLTATLGEAMANCEVIVTQNDRGGPSIEIRIVDEAGGKYRALVDRAGEQIVIKILGGHSAIRRYLGPGPDFPNQEELGARLMIAEIVAGEASRIIMERRFSTSGDLDAPEFYSEHLTYMDRYLMRCHRMMVSDSEL